MNCYRQERHTPPKGQKGVKGCALQRRGVVVVSKLTPASMARIQARGAEQHGEAWFP